MKRGLIGLLAVSVAVGATASTRDRGTGPYHLDILEGGIGVERALAADEPLLRAGAPWSITGWVRIARAQPGTITLARLGVGSRTLALDDGVPVLDLGGVTVRAAATLEPGRWHAVAASYDGARARLFVDGVGGLARALASPAATPSLAIAPVDGAPPAPRHFGGTIIGLTLSGAAIDDAAARAHAARAPDPELARLQRPGAGWEWQLKQWRGLFQPQDGATLPTASTPPSAPVARPAPSTPPLTPVGQARWMVGGWRLAAEGAALRDGAEVSRAGFDVAGWHVATVPGTVLTTLVDRGVHPDPAYGLNNMAIPERLARQRWWYRTEFDAPAGSGARRWLIFKGINYAAEVWLNGQRLGDIRGAFVRGRFDVSAHLRPDVNALAVRIIPPPHPGIPHEASIAAGPGDNGGNLAIDGPTFVASEGWDWIPGIRDRNIGLWQPVELVATGTVVVGDPQVVTDLPLPAIDSARVTITIPVENLAPMPVSATIAAAFDGVRVERTLALPPGRGVVRFTPAEFAQLRVAAPKLWWPNGYGAQNLSTLRATASVGGTLSDTAVRRFGFRELSYGLSLFDSGGRLRRVEVSPTDAAERLVDVTHAGIKRSPGGWTMSLTPAGERSPAVRPAAATSPLPHLTLHVNGVPIAARGGNWGTDDYMKRVARARLEPYFRLHREANLNIIRNWVGQNTEDVFFELADEYGMLILNDFWASTQNFQVEPQDPQMFLANARDVIARYRNHPSIALWFGRNEGVPHPILNEGLDDLVTELDGTRLYTGSSNTVALQDSGPYNYRPPAGYFTDLASGFSVETGTPSLSTIESLEASIPPAERWPLSDTIAYHDWHFGGNGDTATFMAALTTQFGEPTSLADFERKAQMMNLVTHKAMFEGFLAHLWTKNSGRLLWMTHPAWPSNSWQIYSSDYDTHAAYYGAKSANEPVHAQMNLPDFALAVVNTTREPRPGLTLATRITDLAGRVLLNRTDRVDAPPNRTSTLSPLALGPLLARAGVVLVRLVLTDAVGVEVSRNLYWQGRDEAALQAMTAMEAQRLTMRATTEESGERIVRVTLANPGATPALAAKLTLVGADGARVLPAYYSDNYVSLLPGESRRIEVRYPLSAGSAAAIRLRGWNVTPASVAIP